MHLGFLKSDFRSWIGVRRLRSSGLLVLLACLIAPALFGQQSSITVDTIGGGPIVGCGTWAGFEGGNTLDDSQFNGPWSSAVDSQGSLYIADKTNNMIRYLTTPDGGGTTYNYTNFNSAFPDAFSIGYILHAYNYTNAYISHYTNASTNFNRPISVVADGSDNLYILSETDYTIWKAHNYNFTLDIAPLITLPTNNGVPTAMTLAPDSATNIFVTFTNGAIARISQSTSATNVSLYSNIAVFSTNFTIAEQSLTNHTTNVSVTITNNVGASIGGLYTNAVSTNFFSITTNITIAFTNGAISRVFQNGSSVAGFTYVTGGPYGTNNYFWKPAGIALMPNGVLAVSDTLNNAIYLANTNFYIFTNQNPRFLYTGGNGPGDGTGPPNFTQFNQPHGIAVSSTGEIVVADFGNNMVRLIDSNVVTTTLYGVISNDWSAYCCGCVPALYPGWVDGSPGCLCGSTNASGREPISVTISPSGSVYVTEIYYDVIRSVHGTGLLPLPNSPTITTNGSGLPAPPSINPSSGYFPQCVTIAVSNSTPYAFYTTNGTVPTSNSIPVSLTNQGGAYVGAIEWCEPQHDLASLEIVAFSGAGYSTVVTGTSPTNFPAPSITPSSGYFPECVTISISNATLYAFYTTDGTVPTTNSIPVVLTNEGQYFLGTIDWCNPQRDLSALQIVGFDGNIYTPVTVGTAPATNDIGFARTQYAGQGATVLLPVVLSLSSNQVLKSIQFRVEVTPTNAAMPAVTGLATYPITPNDFVQLVGPAPGNAPVSYTTSAYSVPPTEGLSLLTGQNSGFAAQGFCVATLIKFTVPPSVPVGQAYQISVIDPSGTSDGIDAFVQVVPLASQLLIVSDLPYMVGDTVSTNGENGYDAGEFGDGQLFNADVNSILLASVGIRKPPSFTDAYNAMDAYPPDAPGNPGGDGKIDFFDWNITYNRSLGLPGFTNNWTRQWSASGLIDTPVTWTYGGPPVPLSMRKNSLAATNPPGMVWQCQASIGAGTVVNVSQGSQCTMPVYANVLSGYSLAGLQFRAIVSPNGSAPTPTNVKFTLASGVPGGVSLTNTPSDTVYAWPLGAFSPALENSSNLLGYVTFLVPSTAQAGQSYTLSFAGVGGGLNLTPPAYQMESFPGYAVVGSSSAPAPSITSDEWKTAFFGSVTNPLAADNADPDGDGVPNWAEYLAGTNPTNALSSLHFGGAAPASTPRGGVIINWLTAPEKTYILESKTTLAGGTWTPVSTNVGDGNVYQFTQTNHSGNACFYRIRVKP